MQSYESQRGRSLEILVFGEQLTDQIAASSKPRALNTASMGPGRTCVTSQVTHWKVRLSEGWISVIHLSCDRIVTPCDWRPHSVEQLGMECLSLWVHMVLNRQGVINRVSLVLLFHYEHFPIHLVLFQRSLSSFQHDQARGEGGGELSPLLPLPLSLPQGVQLAWHWAFSAGGRSGEGGGSEATPPPPLPLWFWLGLSQP